LAIGVAAVLVDFLVGQLLAAGRSRSISHNSLSIYMAISSAVKYLKIYADVKSENWPRNGCFFFQCNSMFIRLIKEVLVVLGKLMRYVVYLITPWKL
jgi:hypothetical protein